MTTSNREWIQINDFSKGIRQTVRVPTVNSSPQELGAADAKETYRCIALPRGGLAPLPKRTNLYSVGEIYNIADTLDGEYIISGIHAGAPLRGDYPDFHIAMMYGIITGDNIGVEWLRIRDIHGTPAQDNIYTSSYSGDDGRRWGAWFADGTAHPTDATLIGEAATALGWRTKNVTGAPADAFWGVMPNPGAPTVDGATPVGVGFNTYHPGPMLQHQGRFLAFDMEDMDKGASADVKTNDLLVYTAVNLLSVSTISANLFAQGTLSGVGAAGSVSAGELLIVRHNGGGMIISGDLDNPTVLSMPGVMSTHGAYVQGVFSPLGFIYVVKDGGAYSWTGGGASEKLSMDLDDNFWYMTPATWDNFDGKLALWGDWVLFPNNWLLDTLTGSWWRMEDADNLQIFQWTTSPLDGTVYGSPLTCTEATTTVYSWSLTEQATSFRWRSNVLFPTVDRYVNVREVTIRAVGPANSTVTITVSAEDGSSQAETFTLDSATVPKLYRRPTKLTGSCLKVQIDSDGGANAAPVVFEVNLEIAPVARATS